MNRRGFLAGCLAVGIAPAVGRAEWLMRGRGERWVMQGAVVVPNWMEQTRLLVLMGSTISALDECLIVDVASTLPHPDTMNIVWKDGGFSLGTEVFCPTFKRDPLGRHVYMQTRLRA